MEAFDLISQFLATAPPTPDRPPPPGWLQFLQSFGPIIFIILIFYFLLFRSKRRQERQRQEMLAALKKGDRVQTIGGILGTVMEARDSEVLLKVDESSNTKIRFARSAIARVLEEDKA